MFLPSSLFRMSTDSCLVNLVFFLFSMSFFPPSTLRSWTDPDLLKLLTFLPTFLFRSAVDKLWLRLLRNIILAGGGMNSNRRRGGYFITQHSYFVGFFFWIWAEMIIWLLDICRQVKRYRLNKPKVVRGKESYKYRTCNFSFLFPIALTLIGY